MTVVTIPLAGICAPAAHISVIAWSGSRGRTQGPVRVRARADGRYDVLDGCHRLTRAWQAGRTEIDAVVETGGADSPEPAFDWSQDPGGETGPAALWFSG